MPRRPVPAAPGDFGIHGLTGSEANSLQRSAFAGRMPAIPGGHERPGKQSLGWCGRAGGVRHGQVMAGLGGSGQRSAFSRGDEDIAGYNNGRHLVGTKKLMNTCTQRERGERGKLNRDALAPVTSGFRHPCHNPDGFFPNASGFRHPYLNGEQSGQRSAFAGRMPAIPGGHGRPGKQSLGWCERAGGVRCGQVMAGLGGSAGSFSFPFWRKMA